MTLEVSLADDQFLIRILFLIYALSYAIVFFTANYFQKKYTGQSTFVLGKGELGWHLLPELGHQFVLLLWGLAILLIVLLPDLSLMEITTAPSDFGIIIGFLLMFTGVGLFGWVRWVMGGAWRVGIDHATKTQLITTGPFHFSRNPAYVSIHLMFLGSFLVTLDFLFLLFFGFYMVFTHFQILEEEKFLKKTHGKRFYTYQRKVGRYFWRF